MKSKRDQRRQAPQQGVIGASPNALLEGGLLASVAALLVATPLVYSEGTVMFGAAAALHVAWLLVLVGWTLAKLWQGGDLRIGATGIAAAALIGLHTLSALVMGSQGNFRHALNILWQWIAYGTAAFLIRQLARSQPQCRALVVIMIGLAAVEATHGYYEYFVLTPARLAAFRENPEKVYDEMGVSRDPESADRKLAQWRLESIEPLGTFALTNSLAGFLAPWLIAVIGIALASFWRPELRTTTVTAAVIAIAIAGCLLLTKSRTAVLATILGIGLLAMYGRPRGWRIDWRLPAAAAGALLVLGLVAVAVKGLDVQVLSEAPTSVLYRVQYWQATAAIIRDYPLLGCGPGNFQEYYAAYKLPQASETIADPHNFLLEIWATAGTPALLALLAVMGAFVWQLTRPGKTSDTAAASNDATISRLWIYAGAAGGIFLAYPAGIIVGFPQETLNLGGITLPLIWLIGIPLIAGAIWSLDRWVQRGDMPTAIPIIALIALLVNLLAAGATSFPGVFNSAWILLALALVAGHTPAWRIPLTKSRALLLVAASLALLAACVRTELAPVVEAGARLTNASAWHAQNRYDAAEQELLAATDADPWAPEPRRLLADLRLRKWLDTGDAGDLLAFEQAADVYAASNPAHYRQYEMRGNWYLLAWRKSGGSAHLDKSLAAYREAVRWYPAKALNHAQLAWALAQAGHQNEARTELELALRLDAQNPHAEQKLRQQRIYDPRLRGQRVEFYRPENAEQTLIQLRTSIVPEDGS